MAKLYAMCSSHITTKWHHDGPSDATKNLVCRKPETLLTRIPFR